MAGHRAFELMHIRAGQITSPAHGRHCSTTAHGSRPRYAVDVPVARAEIEDLKIACLVRGVRLTADAAAALGPSEALSIHEYPTTGGLTLLVAGIYVNTPFDHATSQASPVTLAMDAGGIAVVFREHVYPVERMLPLPGYLDKHLGSGREVADLVMTHVDRARVSPIKGCAYDCDFCNLADLRYERRDPDELLDALAVAKADTALPVRHALISGGSPGRSHVHWFNELCERIIASAGIPVDVMFSPQHTGGDTVDRLVDAGVASLSINIEIFDSAASELHIRAKHRFARPHFEETALRAVERLGRHGRVRSLIIPGVEDEDRTLAGVEYLASLGVDPVLSPFRPTDDIRLREQAPPSTDSLRRILDGAREIVAKYDVALGPSCESCQHNTLTFPWDNRHDDRRD
jgi:hypothetical protein